jgi:hypothetical protein
MKVYKKVLQREAYCRHRAEGCEGQALTKTRKTQEYNRKKKKWEQVEGSYTTKGTMPKGTEVFVIHNDGDNSYNKQVEIIVCQYCMYEFLAEASQVLG